MAIPDEFRPDMAMVGEWQVTSQKIVEGDGEKKPDALALGVRKRVLDEEEEVALEAKKRRWGSTHKAHPGQEEDMGDLDALLRNATRKREEVKKEEKKEDELKFKMEMNGNAAPKIEGIEAAIDLPTTGETQQDHSIKNEPVDDKVVIEAAIPTDDTTPNMEATAVPGVVFKKRKAKNIRQK